MEDVVLTTIQLNDFVVVLELAHASGAFETLLHVQSLENLLFILKEKALDVVLFVASVNEKVSFENFIENCYVFVNKFQLFYELQLKSR